MIVAERNLSDITVTYVVVNENILAYIGPEVLKQAVPYRCAEILHASVLKGASHSNYGPVGLRICFDSEDKDLGRTDMSYLRLATAKDFEEFRCNPPARLFEPDQVAKDEEFLRQLAASRYRTGQSGVNEIA